MSNLAGTLWHCDERREAIELMTRTVEASTAKLGGEHPTTRRRMDSLTQMRAMLAASPHATESTTP